jgi:phosphatidylserine decarboxylase
MTFAKEATPFVAPFAVLAVLLILFGKLGWALTLALVGSSLLLFFRIPRRRLPSEGGIVVAPANGRILRVEQVAAPNGSDQPYHQIVTFLSVFDVHVQRAPVKGEIISSSHTTGRKVAAFRPHAAAVNENHLTLIRCDNGDVIGIRQIAGLLARRVVNNLRAGDRVEQGELIGLIKFGSRVDLLLPAGYQLEIQPKQRLKEGESLVARWDVTK